MKKFSLFALGAWLILAAMGFGGDKYETLKIGAKAPMVEHKMASTNGETTTLNKLKGENGTLVIFSCNTCPFVIAWEDRYPDLARETKDASIGFVLINSNEAKRQGDDSMEEMKEHASEKGYADIPYLVDKNSLLANAFGGKTTPHVFLFNNDWELVYEGAIDDNYKDADAVNQRYLHDAIHNLIDGKPINPNDTKAIGCSIKRVLN
ncbi:MAG: thioredoxin family protein [Verrucomicrobia bacterium]|nr:thioredoxin family protein [Verrucomicrobiota bacterium]